MRKKKDNYLLAIMNIIGIIASAIFLVFASELADTTRKVYDEVINIYGDNIVGFFLGNIKIWGLILYLGLALPNIISAIKNKDNKKLLFWQMIFGLSMIYTAINNFIPQENEDFFMIANSLVYYLLPIVISIRNIIFIKKGHPSKLQIVSYILCIVFTVIAFIIYWVNKYNYISLIWGFIIIFMQLIYIHEQDNVGTKNNFIEIIIFYIIQPIIVLAYAFLLIYSIFSTKFSENELNIERENVKQSIIELNCTDDKYCMPVIKNNKYGFIDENGEEVIDIEYDTVSYFYSIELNNNTYYFAFATQNDDYYLISKENKKIQIEKTKIFANIERLSAEIVDEIKETLINNQSIGDILSNGIYIATYMNGEIKTQSDNEIYEKPRLELQELENENYYEDSYYYDNENFSIEITPLDVEDEDYYTLCNVEVRQENGEIYSSQEKIYGLETYDDAIKVYSDGYIGFKSEDETIDGWYDNYGNKYNIRMGNLNIIDVKNDMMILEKENDSGFQYYIYNLNGERLINTEKLISLPNCYIIYNSNNKPVIYDNNLEQISDEYDEIIN